MKSRSLDRKQHDRRRLGYGNETQQKQPLNLHSVRAESLWMLGFMLQPNLRGERSHNKSCALLRRYRQGRTALVLPSSSKSKCRFRSRMCDHKPCLAECSLNDQTVNAIAPSSSLYSVEEAAIALFPLQLYDALQIPQGSLDRSLKSALLCRYPKDRGVSAK